MLFTTECAFCVLKCGEKNYGSRNTFKYTADKHSSYNSRERVYYHLYHCRVLGKYLTFTFSSTRGSSSYPLRILESLSTFNAELFFLILHITDDHASRTVHVYWQFADCLWNRKDDYCCISSDTFCRWSNYNGTFVFLLAIPSEVFKEEKVSQFKRDKT